MGMAAVLLCAGDCRPAGDPATPPESSTAPDAVPKPAAEPTPAVALELSGPNQVTVGETFTFKLVINNDGKVPGAGLKVRSRWDPGLEPIPADSPADRDLGNLAPGETRQMDVKCRATRPGSFSYRVEVVSGGKVLATDWRGVTAAGAAGESAQAGPREESGPDLGPPLVDKPDRLKLLHPYYPVWFDPDGKQVVMVGAVCQREVPLELFACLKGSKEHESVVVVASKAYVVHAGLLATGAEAGNPVQFYPEYVPARGTEIEITVVWKDQQGRRQRARAQDWIRDATTQKAMAHPWVFAGSRFSKDETTGEQFYHADGEGDLICVSNFPSAVLDLPIKSSDSDASLLFEAFTERIPPRGTAVTLILAPKREKQGQDRGQEKSEPQSEPPQAVPSSD